MSAKPPPGSHSHDHRHGDDHGHAHGHDHHHGHSHAADPAAKPGHEHAGLCTHGSLAEHHPRTDAICFEHVSYRYPGGSADRGDVAPGKPGRPDGFALRDITIHIEQGCNLGIIGPNGAGKTTLLKILLGVLEDYSGSVSIFGLTPRQACRKGDVIGYVPQRHDVEWRFPVSVRQVVRMGLVGKTGLFRFHKRDDLAYVESLLERTGIANLAQRPVGDLSGGQQQRLFIARALAPRPRILVLDEPTVGVDEAGQRQLAILLHELHESLGLTVIVVSHDLKAIAESCNRVAVLRQSLHFHDSPRGLTREVLAEVFQHDIAPGSMP